MLLTTEETIEVELFKITLHRKLLQKKIDRLANQIENFLVNGPDFSNEFEEIGAFQFEYNYYLDFQYVGSPHYLFDDTWSKNIILDVIDDDDGLIKSELMEAFMSNPKISSEINQRAYYNAIRACDGLFFSEAWKKAEEKVQSGKLCFVDIHESSAGYDYTSMSYLSESQIESKVQEWKESNL